MPAHTEYVIILNVSDAVHKYKVTVKATEQLPRQRRIQNTVEYFDKKNEVWAKVRIQKIGTSTRR